MEDRNGNLITFTFQSTSSGGIYTATDPLNRKPTINLTEDLHANTQDVITYPGSGSSTHPITVNYALLHDVLASGESVQTYQCLFPELNGSSSSSSFNGYVISSVGLPDGTSYQISYNSYGEVARLQLPTGGVYVYKYLEAGCQANGNSGVLALANNSGYRIYRRLQERDEYSDGTNPSAKIVFPAPATNASNGDPNHGSRPTTNVEVDFEDASNNLMRKELHYFYGNPGSTQPPPTDPTTYASWWEGLEFRTDVSDAAQLWQSQARVFQQRPCNQPSEACPGFDPQSETAPAHDPQMCQANSTLDSGMISGVVWAYDAYSNQTAQYEFDYGAAPGIGASCPGSPNGFTRRTIVQYAGTPYTDTGNHIVTLPISSTVDAGGAVVAETLYSYDGSGVSDAPGIVGHDGSYGTGFTVRGNLTNPAQCLNPPNCTSLINHASTYDIAGNVTSSQDGGSRTTVFAYNDDNANEYAFPTSITNAAGQKTLIQYDYGAGKPAWSTDANGVKTFYSYSDWRSGLPDPLDRLCLLEQASGTPLEAHTWFDYNNSPASVDAYQDQNTSGDSALHSRTVYDSGS